MRTSSVDIEKNKPSITKEVGSTTRTDSPTASANHRAIDEWVNQFKTDYTSADLAPIDRALCDFATKLTRTPWQMAESDISNLRTLGLTDRAIHDATQVIAYFNYINRIADGLHVDLEPGM